MADKTERRPGGGSQHYIGTPNGVVLCIDAAEGNTITGRYYHGYSRQPVEIRWISELVFGLESFYNAINVPRAATNERLFHESRHAPPSDVSAERQLSDQELLERFGRLATFIIRVQQRQNSTWQGRLTWVEENRTQNFRSVVEMVHLLEDALQREDATETE
jgi:hypothetical protein